MAKSTGLGMGFYVGGVDVSGDVGSFETISGGQTSLNLTGIDKFGFERLGGLRTGAVDFTAYFQNVGTHPVLSSLPTGVAHMLGRMGAVQGNPAFAMRSKQLGYNPKRGADGSLLFTVNAVSDSFGLQWGNLLTAGNRTDVAPTAGVGVDFGATAGGFGQHLYVHLLSFTGTSITFISEHSADNGAGDPYNAVSSPTVVLTAAGSAGSTSTTSAVASERWLRLVTSGTFTSAVFTAMAVNNEVATAF